MRFVIHQEALNGSDEVLALLDRLIDRVADEIHRIEVLDADMVKSSAWYASARQTRKKILISAISIPPRAGPAPDSIHSGKFDIANLEEAIVADSLAHAPLTILVEDREADGVFLDMVVEELASDEFKAVWRRGAESTPRAYEIVTSGGIDAMPLRIDRLVVDALAESRPHRVFVYCDSDIRWPGDEGLTARTRSDLKDKCEQHAIALHVLSKRNIENYIPDTVFLALKAEPYNLARQRVFDAFFKLTPLQRDHFPIKDGLSRRERDEAHRAGLYVQNDLETLEVLEERLLPKRPRPMITVKNERRECITAAALRERDAQGELELLLIKIASEL
ncbi:hypothetical protein ACX3YG_21725 [Pseudomonas wadenswilerensis]